MDIHVLGPLRADLGGVSVIPSATKPRQIIALLACHPGQVIPALTLMEETWGANVPETAGATLQTYILQLRRLLRRAMGPQASAAAKEVLATRHGGYLLQIPPESVDLHRYEQLTAAGQRAFNAGNDERAAGLLRDALTLWRGPALVDVGVGPELKIEVMRLEQSRLVTVERRVDADLRLGRHAQLLPELTDLTARHPHHEGFHSQAMVALYRVGRQASALEVYRRLRLRLVTELGVEPTPQLQRLHLAMLAVDQALDVTSGPRHTSTYDLYAA